MMKTDRVNALVYCEGAFNTPNGKTAHGLVRFTERYRVLGVIDSVYEGQDAGMVIDGKPANIPIYASLENAIEACRADGRLPSHFVVGLAPDGGRLDPQARDTVKRALALGLNVDSGLHDFLSEDAQMTDLARKHNAVIRDIRKPPHRNQLHFFTGKIEEVTSLKIAVLGTDSAVGKRTTAWILVHALRKAGYLTELIGTGQTAWLQGARYSIVLDSIVNDFVSGEIEHAVWSAWKEGGAEVVVLEGQGSLMNPAYPGGFELLAAGRPDIVILQHAPARKDYDGFPGYPIHPLHRQIEAIQLLAGKPVIAVTINHENMKLDTLPETLLAIENIIAIPVYDVLHAGADGLVDQIVTKYLNP